MLTPISEIWKKVYHYYFEPKMDDGLETAQQYRERWRSVYIVYFTMFMVSLGFSIIVTGVWPYLDKVCTNSTKSFIIKLTYY